eukprot:313834-Chlamydomonas_euryale.AAC.2
MVSSAHPTMKKCGRTRPSGTSLNLRITTQPLHPSITRTFTVRSAHPTMRKRGHKALGHRPQP